MGRFVFKFLVLCCFVTVVVFRVFYDGSLFNGFVGGVGSVEYYLRRAIGYFVRGFTLSKASRTDPGVSAVGNVVSVRYDGGVVLSPGMVNSRLPEGVWTWAWARVGEDFRARRAVSRTYVYVMPWLNEDVGEMGRAAGLFVGTHDLINFQVRERGVPSVVTIYDVSVRREGSVVVFVIRGRGFRNRMIRKIVNSLRLVGLGVLSVDELAELISGRVRRPVPPAPPYGLFLLSVDYGVLEPRWVLYPDGVSRIINYLNYRVNFSLSAYSVTMKILSEFMDIDKIFSRN